MTVKINLSDLLTYQKKCHLCGADLEGDEEGIKNCTNKDCNFRLLKNKIPFKAKRTPQGKKKCCGG